jgi:Tol biopolymer transport system component/predicted Ser/Thr protein kinase
MAVTAGTRIGAYEIVSPLGSGGMGEVYRGLDTKLNRPVAIKFLSDLLANPAARRRFQREAQTASSLNHPHILTVYDAGELDDRQYLVTEYVDGGTFQHWVQTEARTWRHVVELLTGVADALAAAHAAGILHRDLKPANVLVAKSGYAKLADFGLATTLEPAGDEAITLATQRTQAGLVVGTIAYMSPEQAAGKPLDARSDIFSFGVMLYEALTGRRPFSGTTDLELLQTIIHRPPEPLPAHLPAGLRAIVEKALENDPSDRYQSMRELVVDLRRLARQKTTDTSETVVPAASRSARRLRPLAMAGAALLLGVGVAAAWWWRGRPAPVPENPLANAVFARFTNFEGTERSGAISPDGRFVAFRADREGPFDVWVSQVGTGRFINLTHGADDEFSIDTPSVGFSGDGSEIWLSGGAGRRLRLLPLMGGAPRPFLADQTVTAAWSPDLMRIVYHIQNDGDSMFVADRTGANARQIFRQTPGRHNHFPVWSPDGRWIYFASGTPVVREMDLWRIAPEGGSPERLTWHNGPTGFPTPLDARSMLYVATDRDGSGPWLWALDVERKLSRRVSVGVEKYLTVAASADGRRIVATVANPGASLWSAPILRDRPAEESDVKLFPLQTADASAPRYGATSLFYLSSLSAGDGLWRFNDGQAVEIWKDSDGSLMAPPAVAPDGRRIAIVLRRDGKLRLHALSADGTGLQSIAESVDVRGGASWAPDGQWIVTGGIDARGAGLFKIPSGGGEPERLVAGEAFNPVWSPDGNLIVYAGANVSLFQPLLAIRPDGTRVELPAIRVRRDGERARFMPDGKSLIYMQGELRSQDFWLLDLATKNTRLLARLTRRDPMRTFDITPDGQRIVFDRLRENADIVLIDRPQ